MELCHNDRANEEYIQCTLIRNLGISNYETVSYLPIKFARLNHLVLLKNEKDEWVKWKITNVGNSLNERPNINQMIKDHRSRTGDSLPKKKDSK